MEEKPEGEVPEAEDRVSRRNWCLKQQGEVEKRGRVHFCVKREGIHL